MLLQRTADKHPCCFTTCSMLSASSLFERTLTAAMMPTGELELSTTLWCDVCNVMLSWWLLLQRGACSVAHLMWRAALPC